MNSVHHVFKNTHYGLSTAAAVLYAIGWLVATQVHAESNRSFILPAVVVTAARTQATLDAVVVVATRDQNYATLEPVMVLAARDATMTASSGSHASAAKNVVAVAASREQQINRKGLVARVSHWFASR